MPEPRNILTVARKLKESETTITIFGQTYPTVRLDSMPTVPRLLLLEAYQAMNDAEAKDRALRAQLRATNRIPRGLAKVAQEKLEALRDVVRAVVPTLPADVLDELDEEYIEELTQLFLEMKRVTMPGATPTADATETQEETPEEIPASEPVKPKTPTRTPKRSTTRRSSAKSASVTPATA